MNEGVLVVTLAAAVAAGTPLVLAGLGELLTERVGVVNLGVEGMMLLGAASAFLVAQATSSVTAGMFGGMGAAALLAFVHAFLSVTMRANQIVSGLALVIFGSGIAIFLGRPIEGQPLAVHLGQLQIPVPRRDSTRRTRAVRAGRRRLRELAARARRGGATCATPRRACGPAP